MVCKVGFGLIFCLGINGTIVSIISQTGCFKSVAIGGKIITGKNIEAGKLANHFGNAQCKR